MSNRTKTTDSEFFIQSLIDEVQLIISQVEQLKSYELHELQWRAYESSWNILECLEHLNLYGDYYLPKMESKIAHATSQADPLFSSGWVGGYLAKSMLPSKKLNKMKTFKDKNPLYTPLDKSTIERFIEQQLWLLDLLARSQKVSLNKVKIEISIATFVKIRLGDTFQFLINHTQRHLEQINTITQSLDRDKH